MFIQPLHASVREYECTAVEGTHVNHLPYMTIQHIDLFSVESDAGTILSGTSGRYQLPRQAKANDN